MTERYSQRDREVELTAEGIVRERGSDREIELERDAEQQIQRDRGRGISVAPSFCNYLSITMSLALSLNLFLFCSTFVSQSLCYNLSIISFCHYLSAFISLAQSLCPRPSSLICVSVYAGPTGALTPPPPPPRTPRPTLMVNNGEQPTWALTAPGKLVWPVGTGIENFFCLIYLYLKCSYLNGKLKCE